MPATLPQVPIPTDTVDVNGTKVAVRGLSRGEVVRLGRFGKDIDAAETFTLALGTGTTEEIAAAWREATPSDAVGRVVDRIVELSGLVEEAHKSDGERSPVRDD